MGGLKGVFQGAAYGGVVSVGFSVLVACLFGVLVRVVVVPRLLPVLSVEDLLQVVSTVAALFCCLLVFQSLRAADSSPSRKCDESAPSVTTPMDSSPPPAAAAGVSRSRQARPAASQQAQVVVEEEEYWEDEGADEEAREPGEAGGAEEEDEEAEAERGAKSMPIGFLSQCKGNRGKALKRWALTRRWRRENRVDRMLLEPHRTFDVIKQFYPHFLHGRTKQGDLIMYELAGRMDIAGLRAAGLGPQDVARHSIFVQEFMWRVLDTSPEAHIMTVMDLGQMQLRRITSKDTLDVIRATSEVLNNHYPDRMRRILVVNLPGWMGSAWSIISAVLPPSIREKVCVARSLEDLKQWVDPEHIPREYNGQAPEGDSEEERKLKQLVAAVNEGRPLPPDLTIAGMRRRRRRTGADVSQVLVGAGAVPPLESPKPPGSSLASKPTRVASAGGGRSTIRRPNNRRRRRLGFRDFMSQLNCFKRHHSSPASFSSGSSRLEEEQVDHDDDARARTQSFAPGSTLPASPLPYNRPDSPATI